MLPVSALQPSPALPYRTVARSTFLGGCGRTLRARSEPLLPTAPPRIRGPRWHRCQPRGPQRRRSVVGSSWPEAATGGISMVECYDPEADRWLPATGMRCGMARYDTAMVGRRMYMEGWQWPFCASPQAGVYDVDRDMWEEMSEGMREGWTGASAVVEDRLLIVTNYGDSRVKAYDDRSDTWRGVEGGGVPPALKRSYTVSGMDGKIFVVGRGLEVGVGMVVAEVAGEVEGRKRRRIK